MNLMKLLAASLATTVLLVGCGGGGKDAGTSAFGGEGSGTGGSGSGGTTTSASLTLDLLNASNASTRFTQGGQNYTVAVTLKDASGNAVPSTTVTVSATDFTLTPASGKKLTGSSGVATVGLTQIDSSASAATQICATALISAASVSNCIDVQMGAVSAQLGTLTPASSTVAAYQSIQVSVPATIGGSTPAVGVPVNFTASCGKVSPASINTDSSGIAQVSYTNDNSGSTCSGSVTISAMTEAETKTAVITAQGATASSIAFKGATRSKIYLQGSPGNSSSVVTFQLLDQNSVAIRGQTLVLDFIQRPAGASLREAGTSSVESTTDASGNVAVTVLSGTAPGPVQVRAYLKTNASIFNVSNGLSIASGLPTQNAFSLSVSTFNIEAWDEDGVTTFLTVRAADRLGNPVPDGTAINFISAGGQVVASCLTSGAEAASTSSCSVTLSSQAPRPSNGRVTVLAWAQGEETFVDNSSPRNNVYDASTDTFEDLGQPFLDSNFNGVFDSGEAAVARASGTSACPVTSSTSFKVVPNTCDGTWGSASVFRKTEIVFSGNVPDANNLNMTGFTPSAGRCLYEFDIKDARGNPLPAGTTLDVSAATGGVFLGFGGEGNKVPNTNDVTRTSHSAIFNTCPSLSGLEFTLNVTTPKGIKTSFFVP